MSTVLEQHDSNRKPFRGELVMKDEERMEPIPSNGAELVRLNAGKLVDLAPPGSVQITVFIMMLIAGIFQGYDNLALAYTATDFSKELGMTPAALATAFTAGLSGSRVIAFSYGPVEFGLPPASRLELIWHWRSLKKTLVVWRQRLRPKLFSCTIGAPAANRSSPPSRNLTPNRIAFE